MIRQLALCSVVLLAAACTPGGAPSMGGSGALPSGNVVRIDVSLTLFPAVQTSAGSALGYSPEVTDVNVGDRIVFVNDDNFGNTATLIPGASTFPANSPLGASATSQSGATLSQPWSSGALTQAGATSQAIIVDRPGTYLYGCFFHYDGRMRGEIVAQ
jgi:plastocyanin